MAPPEIFQSADAESLYNDLRRANTESAKKERFLHYLSVAFAADEGARKLISDLTLGAERFIANITRGNRLATGRADSQTDTIIIEWEKDLARTGEHARQQLEEYLEGNWRSGQQYRFVLLATDGIRWRRYAPDWSEIDLDDLALGRNFKLREIRAFNLGPESFDEFPLFLDEVLFVSQPRQATLENIQTDFGDTSGVFINSVSCLQDCVGDIERDSELRVAFGQWRRFLSVAYGKFDDSPTMFLVHTYLSVFAKFIAYAVVTRKPITDDATVKGILDGSGFESLNIERFVEDDFFHWVGADHYFKRLRAMFQQMSLQLTNYDFSDVREDILKGLYQELIDLETRHALGEYYTPDWLCQRVVEELEITRSSSFLDPACGSGSFLRAVIARMKHEFPDLGAEELAEQVVGIDIHPLSVLISKATVLLSLGTAIPKAKRPVTLHVYLANSLLVPRGTADIFEQSFKVAVDNENYVIEVKGLTGANDFDKLITFCDDVVQRYDQPEPIERKIFTKSLTPNLPATHARELPNQLYDIYKGMKTAQVAGRDSIWKFILQNSYKPVFLKERFDFVVGNPPWLTYASITNSEYQGLMLDLSNEYGVTPHARANMPHLEIAAIFLAHSVNYFLKPDGLLGFVLPRSFMSADQHDNTRGGGIEGMRLSRVWDLYDVSVLFRVPSCVLFAVRTSETETAQRQIPADGLPGVTFSGSLPRSQVEWAEVTGMLNQESCKWYYSRLQNTEGNSRSALTTKPMTASTGTNPYERRFFQGATIVPRNCFFVEITQQMPPNNNVRERVVALQTSRSSDREAKAPWKGQMLTGRAEGSLLFRTAISRNILPFALVDPPLVLLPVVGGEKKESFRVLTADRLFERGMTYGSKWFLEAEKIWEKSRTEKNKKRDITLSDYLDWQNKLTSQNPRARWLVLYTASATNASAVVVDRRKFDCPFIVESKAYWCECMTEAEAHYLSAYINSGYANDFIKEFQSRGLFGPRDIHKLIVKIPFPEFEKRNKDHKALSKLGLRCAALAKDFLTGVEVRDLQPRALGKVRSRLKDQLSTERDKIDALVEKLSKLSTKNPEQYQPKPKKRIRHLRTLGTLL